MEINKLNQSKTEVKVNQTVKEKYKQEVEKKVNLEVLKIGK